MFQYSNDYNDDLYGEVESIVNETLDVEAPEDQIEELTRALFIILKEYTRTLIHRSTFSYQNSIFNSYQPAFPYSFNPFLISNFNYPPFSQPIPPLLPSQISKRKIKPSKQNRSQKKTIQISSKSTEETQLKPPQPPQNSNDKPTPISHPSFFSVKSTVLTKSSDDDNDNGHHSNQLNDERQTQASPKPRRMDSFSSCIYKVLKTIHPNIGISSKSMMIMNSFVLDIFERAAREAGRLSELNDRVLRSREVQTAMRLVLPSELARNANTQGTQAVASFAEPDLNEHSENAEGVRRSTIIFPIGYIFRLLNEGNYAERIGAGAPVYMAAALEYITRQVLDPAGNLAIDNQKERISPRHILLAIRNNEELNQLLTNLTVVPAGVVPHVQRVLLGSTEEQNDEA